MCQFLPIMLLLQAKTTKKIVLRLQCQVCKAVHMHALKVCLPSLSHSHDDLTVVVGVHVRPRSCQQLPTLQRLYSLASERVQQLFEHVILQTQSAWSSVGCLHALGTASTFIWMGQVHNQLLTFFRSLSLIEAAVAWLASSQ